MNGQVLTHSLVLAS
jgi:hypothetical protein